MDVDRQGNGQSALELMSVAAAVVVGLGMAACTIYCIGHWLMGG